MGQPLLPGLRVGLMGGSFNPAHAGHLAVSQEALKRLDLDQVWWLVAPQNPLKPVAGMAPLADRIAGARKIARDKRIKIVCPEAVTGTRFTVHTVAALQEAYPRHRFVWLMGTDNLQQLPRWHRWQDLMTRIPIAVMARPSYDLRAMTGRAAQQFRKDRLPPRRGRMLAEMDPPVWTFLNFRHRTESSTAIRARADGPGKP